MKRRVIGPTLEDLTGTAEATTEIGPPRPTAAQQRDDAAQDEDAILRATQAELRAREEEARTRRGGSVRAGWMTQLPTDRTSLARAGDAGPRTFRRVAVSETDKAWAETPSERAQQQQQQQQQKEKKQQQQHEEATSEAPAAKRRASDQQQRREKTLLEEHAELARVGKARTMGQTQPRGPWEAAASSSDAQETAPAAVVVGPPKPAAYWDREQAMDERRVDPKTTQSMLARAGALGERFASSGRASKFL